MSPTIANVTRCVMRTTPPSLGTPHAIPEMLTDSQADRLLGCLREIGPTMRVFALRPSHPSAGRVDQPATLPERCPPCSGRHEKVAPPPVVVGAADQAAPIRGGADHRGAEGGGSGSDGLRRPPQARDQRTHVPQMAAK